MRQMHDAIRASTTKREREKDGMQLPERRWCDHFYALVSREFLGFLFFGIVGWFRSFQYKTILGISFA